MRIASTIGADVRHAIRRWTSRPSLSVAAVLTLSLGIGTATAIFSVVDGVLLRPLEYREPDRLLTMWVVRPRWQHNPMFSASWDRGLLSWPDLRELEAQARTLDSVGVWTAPRRVIIGGQDDVAHVREVSSELLRTLGVHPFAGRTFTRAEQDAPSDVVMVSYEAWQRRFGGDPATVGMSVTIDTIPRTVVGILPRGFQVDGEPPELLLPIGTLVPRDREVTDRDDANRPFLAVARLKPGVTLEAAAADVEPLLRAGKDPARQTARVEPLETLLFGAARRPLFLLLGAAGLLLLIACVNVAALLVGDAALRRPELALRQALGAGQSRLVAQLVTESLTLGAAGGALGLAAAYWILPGLVALAPPDLPRLDRVAVDLRVVACALLASIVTAIAAGLVPALARPAGAPADALRGGRTGAVRGRTQSALVAAQVAIAMVLLAGAALLGETVVRLSAQPLGFDAARLAVLRLWSPPATPAPVRASRRTALVDRLRATPGVQGAALVSAAPFGGNYGAQTIELDTRPGEFVSSRRYIVGGDYFRTMGMPLVAGRDFDRRDVDGLPVVIVSRELARRYFDGDAVGHRISINRQWMTIVGVVPDSKLRALSEPTDPAFYLFLDAVPRMGGDEVVVRTRGDASATAPELRRAVAELGGGTAIASLDTVEGLMRKTIGAERYRAGLSGAFGLAALVLAAVGLYGLLARRVAERRAEIGIRLALGARPATVAIEVARDAARLVVAGLLVGIPAAVAAARLLRSQLFGVEPTSLHVFVMASAALAAAACLATSIPARRAGLVDPIDALRAD